MLDETIHILVAGGLGYIGSHVVVELIRIGLHIIIVDNLVNSTLEIIDQIKKVIKVENISFVESQLVFIQADLLIIDQIEQIFQQYRIKSVIALAGLKSVKESIENPTLYYRTNFNIITNLLTVMNGHQCFQLIFSSSATVYGDNNTVPYDESQQTGVNLANPYAVTKWLIENCLTNITRFDNQWQIIVLRYFNPVGCHSSGLLADNPKKPLNLMPIITRSLVQNKPFEVYGTDYQTQDGTAERDYIHVSDLALAHVCVLNHFENGYQFLNVGLGNPISVLQVIQAFESVNRVKLDYHLSPRRAGDLPSYYAKCEKIKQLGWLPRFNLTDMVKDCYQAIKIQS